VRSQPDLHVHFDVRRPHRCWTQYPLADVAYRSAARYRFEGLDSDEPRWGSAPSRERVVPVRASAPRIQASAPIWATPLGRGWAAAGRESLRSDEHQRTLFAQVAPKIGCSGEWQFRVAKGRVAASKPVVRSKSSLSGKPSSRWREW